MILVYSYISTPIQVCGVYTDKYAARDAVVAYIESRPDLRKVPHRWTQDGLTCDTDGLILFALEDVPMDSWFI